MRIYCSHKFETGCLVTTLYMLLGLSNLVLIVKCGPFEEVIGFLIHIYFYIVFMKAIMSGWSNRERTFSKLLG